MADDKNGTKTMIQSEGNSDMKARTVEISKEISVNKLEKMIGADVYADFPESTTMSFETYSQRAEGLSKALGNNDSVKG